jgi:hypothetical protein
MQLSLSMEVLRHGKLPAGPGSSGSLKSGVRLALMLGLSHDGMFDLMLIEGETNG